MISCLALRSSCSFRLGSGCCFTSALERSLLTGNKALTVLPDSFFSKALSREPYSFINFICCLAEMGMRARSFATWES